jgi:hypothetical protein
VNMRTAKGPEGENANAASATAEDHSLSSINFLERCKRLPGQVALGDFELPCFTTAALFPLPSWSRFPVFLMIFLCLLQV